MRERIEFLIEEYKKEMKYCEGNAYGDGVGDVYTTVIDDLKQLLKSTDEVMEALQYCHDHAHPQQIIQDLTGPLLK